jgi:hypothetical protein
MMRTHHDAFVLDVSTGIGLETGQGSDPTIFLSYSDDGGHTFSDLRPMSLGELGDYLKRVVWNRLGQSRDRIYQVELSDPVDIALLDAYLYLRKGIR